MRGKVEECLFLQDCVGSSGSRHAMGHSEERKVPLKWIGEILVINSQD